MNIKDWKKVSEAPTLIERVADASGHDIVFRIDLRLVERGDAPVRLRDMRGAALQLAGGDAQGVWELKCGSNMAARISISRGAK